MKQSQCETVYGKGLFQWLFFGEFRGQAQRGANFYFDTQKRRILTKVFYIADPNLVILAGTGDELLRGQVRDWGTHTDRQTEATTIPKGQNWPWLKLLQVFYFIWPFLHSLMSAYRECCQSRAPFPLQWRHNEHDGVSNHQSHDCLLQAQIKHQLLCATGLSEGNSPVTSEFPAQRASNAENASIWWRHHANFNHSTDK